MRPLIWFRSDLRVRDNTALSEACRAADEGAAAVFAICPRQWQEHGWSPIKVDFLLRNLADLSRALEEMNIPLLILEAPRFAGLPEKLLEIAEKHRCGGIWLNREYEVDERRRDEAVARLFERAGRSFHAFHDQLALPPDSLRTSQGKFYTVFTPFRRRWIAAVEERGGITCLRKPAALEPVRARPGRVPSSVPGFEGLRRPDIWKSGEQHAHSRLRSFIEGRLGSYRELRDIPAENGTSTLSPYLALGVLSPRQCLRAAIEANRGRIGSGSPGAVTWISELIWREFYRHVLVGFPRVCMDQPFDHRARKIRWRESEEDLGRWKQGKTGVPIVDAGMRQLAETGWMHNRLRMVTAMFLSKNLFLDWRLGEKHFLRSLVDGDFASNNGGWQWSASTGTDAAPYFRIFNPVSQSERFDPSGDFIRRFVPELGSLDDRTIHLPAERAPEALRRIDYPAPVADLKRSRQAAIEKFKAKYSR
ncbi:MAG: deoxyribodipyrimidine photo-lyase [Planctomycetes bacterium]|nr:deoxyribodipyrimidine photo-lyase [Planctomycetota bacterium]